METNIELGIVILNYNSIEYLYKAIEGIKQQNYTNYHIVIVDNHSDSEERKEILKKFKDVDKTDLVFNKKNLGFARGNNVGIKYLRKKYNCNAVFVVNSDTYIDDESFFADIIEKMCNHNVGVISPMCLDKNGEYQIPYGISDGRVALGLIRSFVWIIWTIIRSLLHLNISITKDVIGKDALQTAMKSKYIVQGPAFFLTPSFFKHYTQLFPKTFLYLEETWLILYLKKAGLSTLFLADKEIYHYEGGASQKSFKPISIKKMKMSLRSIFVGIPLLFMNESNIRKMYS